MKKYYSLISKFLIISIVVMLAACSPQTTATTDQGASKNQSQAKKEIETNKTINNKDKAKSVELTISAFASLTDALNELKSRYELQYPNISLNFNYGSSGALQRQIEQVHYFKMT